jgi:hypothetical protein
VTQKQGDGPGAIRLPGEEGTGQAIGPAVEIRVRQDIVPGHDGGPRRVGRHLFLEARGHRLLDGRPGKRRERIGRGEAVAHGGPGHRGTLHGEIRQRARRRRLPLEPHCHDLARSGIGLRLCDTLNREPRPASSQDREQARELAGDGRVLILVRHVVDADLILAERHEF